MNGHGKRSNRERLLYPNVTEKRLLIAKLVTGFYVLS